MRHCNEAGVKLIKKFELFVPNIYKDAVGIPTIGYGHLVSNGLIYNPPWTEEQATKVLKIDLKIAEMGVVRLITSPLDENQFAALCSFVFNLGSGALQRSTLRMRLNRGDYDVENEFLKYCFGGGKKLRGLLIRRKSEALLFDTPDTTS